MSTTGQTGYLTQLLAAMRQSQSGTGTLPTAAELEAVNIQAFDGDLKAIAALTGTTGFLKKTGLNTWILDTTGYLTSITSSQVTTALGYTPVTDTRTLTINGVSYDLTANRSWTVAGGLTSFNTRTGAITLTSGDVTGALGFTPYNATNPAGYITGITSGQVTGALGYTPENLANKGIANGYASLDGSGLVPSTQLPSYVDDVLEYTNLASFPATGTTGKIYIDLATNKVYRWSGTVYIEVSPTVGTIWGGITGTLANQTDLQSALDAKVPTARTLTINGTAFDLSANRSWTINSMVYPAAGIAVSTGTAWGTSLTDNSTNWNTAYSSRISSLTVTGSSGAATLVSNVLNIPTYTLSGLGGQASSTNLTSLSGLSYVSASFVKMTAAGTFTLDTNTYYLSSNPSGYTNNTGTVTSVSGTGTVSGLSISGTVTTTGNITLSGTLAVTASNFSSQTANTFLAAPTGVAGVPTFRTIIAADIPTLNQSTTGSAGSVANLLILKADTGTTEGTDLYTYNGSAAKTLNIVGGSNITITKTAGQWSIAATAGGTGTVTSVSVTTANGISGTVATSTTTPAITLTLGAITPTTVNGLTFTAAATGFTIAGGTTSKTLTMSNTLTLAGTDTSTLNIGTGGTLGTAAFTASTAYQASNTNLTSVAGLTFASTSFVKMTAAGTFALDTNTYYLASNPNSYTANLGTVTSVSVTTANGVSGTVATSTTTPAITLTLGAITPTSVNGVTISGATTPTLSVTGTSSISGSNTGDNAVNSLYSGLVTNATHTGDATGATALTVVGLRGVALPALGVSAGLLKYTGTGTNTWVFDSTAYGTGTVTSVGGTGTVSGLTLTGTVTTTGNLTLGGTLAVTASNFASQTANTFLSAPNGAAGVPTFRAIIAADIPTLNQSTTGSAGSVANSFIIRADSGTTEGTDIYTFNGSAAKNVNFIAGNLISITKAAGSWTIATSATANTGTVTSVGGTGTVSGLSLSGTVTTTGNLTLGGTLAVLPSNFASQTANTFLAAPNGTAGAPTFRTIVAADIPTLNQNTTGTAATITGVYGGTITSSQITTGLGYTPYNSTNPNGYITGYTETDTLASVTGRGASTTTQISINKETTINTTTPGLGTGYGLHFGGQTTADSATGITFSAGNATGTNANAGIYVQGSGAYGTKMYIATTDSYAVGSKTAISIDHTGLVNFVRTRPTYAGNIILDAGNYNSYSPTLTGTGATGTWGISISGNAATATSATNQSGGTVNATTGTFTPNTSGVSTGLTVVNGDITTYRTGGTTGVIYLSNSGTRYLYWDGTNYIMPGGGLTLNGNAVWTVGNLTNLNQLTNGPGYTNNTGTVTSVGGTGSYGGLTLTGTVTTSGSLTLGGTPTGTWPISVSGSAATASSASTSSQVTINYNNDSNSTYQMLWGSGNSVYGTGGIYCNPASDTIYATTFIENSSVRFKENIVGLEGSLDKVIHMRGVKYNKKGTNYNQVGVIAEEVLDVLPEVVNYSSTGEIEGVAYARITAVLIEAIKEQQKQINELKELLNNK